MPISKWLLVRSQSSEYQNRHILKLTGSREEIVSLYKRYQGFMQVPYAIQEEEYGWGVFIDDATAQETDSLQKYLSEIAHPVSEGQKTTQNEKPKIPNKIEIIGSTWDWQDMQMNQGLRQEEQKTDATEPIQSKPKELPPLSEKPPSTEILQELFVDIEPKVKQESTTPLGKDVLPESTSSEPLSTMFPELVPSSKPNTVEVNEIITELNKILADFTQESPSEEKPSAPQIPQRFAPQTPEVPVSPDNTAEVTKKDTYDFVVDNQTIPIKDEIEESSILEISDNDQEQLPDTINQEMKFEISDNDINTIPHEMESLLKADTPPVQKQASNPNIVTITAVVPVGEEQLGNTFLTNVNDSLAKLSKGKVSAALQKTLAIDGQAFEPAHIFRELCAQSSDIVFFLGLEKASAFKMGQLDSLVSDKDIEKKSLEKNQVNKKFMYLDLAASLMILKKDK